MTIDSEKYTKFVKHLTGKVKQRMQLKNNIAAYSAHMKLTKKHKMGNI